MIQDSTHERLTQQDSTRPGSERSFAVVIATALGLLGAMNWWHQGHVWPWLGGTAAVFLIAGYFFPATLKPLNLIWFKFGLLLHSIVSPIVMGIVFYGAVVPTGLVARARGMDPLRLKIERDRDSYWIKRQPPGPASVTMKDQF